MARYYDETLLAALAGGLRQLVLVAAGMDARAFRLEFPAGTRVFELDQPAVLAHKAESTRGQEADDGGPGTLPARAQFAG